MKKIILWLMLFVGLYGWAFANYTNAPLQETAWNFTVVGGYTDTNCIWNYKYCIYNNITWLYVWSLKDISSYALNVIPSSINIIYVKETNKFLILWYWEVFGPRGFSSAWVDIDWNILSSYSIYMTNAGNNYMWIGADINNIYVKLPSITSNNTYQRFTFSKTGGIPWLPWGSCSNLQFYQNCWSINITNTLSSWNYTSNTWNIELNNTITTPYVLPASLNPNISCVNRSLNNYTETSYRKKTTDIFSQNSWTSNGGVVSWYYNWINNPWQVASISLFDTQNLTGFSWSLSDTGVVLSFDSGFNPFSNYPVLQANNNWRVIDYFELVGSGAGFRAYNCNNVNDIYFNWKELSYNTRYNLSNALDNICLTFNKSLFNTNNILDFNYWSYIKTPVNKQVCTDKLTAITTVDGVVYTGSILDLGMPVGVAINTAPINTGGNIASSFTGISNSGGLLDNLFSGANAGSGSYLPDRLNFLFSAVSTKVNTSWNSVDCSPMFDSSGNFNYTKGVKSQFIINLSKGNILDLGARWTMEILGVNVIGWLYDTLDWVLTTLQKLFGTILNGFFGLFSDVTGAVNIPVRNANYCFLGANIYLQDNIKSYYSYSQKKNVNVSWLNSIEMFYILLLTIFLFVLVIKL